MNWYHYINLLAIIFSSASLIFHLGRLIRSGKMQDFSTYKGDMPAAMLYSYTTAMSPMKKESAYLHLPTYSAGIIYHLGSFSALVLFIMSWFTDFQINPIIYFLSVFLFISGICGIGILIKRFVKNDLRGISNPDDYISNTLVTVFQVITGIFLLLPGIEGAYYLISALLLFYFPVGKLKHALYFFAARYHLGFFYGWRGIWPVKHFKEQ